MSRDNSRVVFKHAPGAASGAGAQVAYFATDRPLEAKSLVLMGRNPAAADGDTLAVEVAYSTNGSDWTVVGAVAATEYNDTDNTLALTALAPTEKVAEGSFTTQRIPALAAVRITQTWAGTVTDGDAETHFSATPL